MILRIFSKEYVANSLLLDESNRESEGIKATLEKLMLELKKKKRIRGKINSVRRNRKAKTKNEELEQSIKEIEDIFKSKEMNIQGNLINHQ